MNIYKTMLLWHGIHVLLFTKFDYD